MGLLSRRGRVRYWYGFLPKEQGARLACERAIERAIIEEGQVLLGWRTVPVNRHYSYVAKSERKRTSYKASFHWQGSDIFVQDAFERKLMVIRKIASNDVTKLDLKHGREFYFLSPYQAG